jgi:hypothetical protein
MPTDRWWDVKLPNGTDVKVKAETQDRAYHLVGMTPPPESEDMPIDLRALHRLDLLGIELLRVSNLIKQGRVEKASEALQDIEANELQDLDEILNEWIMNREGSLP